MSAGTEQRKLAAIMFTNTVGYLAGLERGFLNTPSLAVPAYFTNSPTKRTLRWHD